MAACSGWYAGIIVALYTTKSFAHVEEQFSKKARDNSNTLAAATGIVATNKTQIGT